jgi:multidrug efflux pump subunit AcrA (membrane-fusion protein)
LTVPVDAVLDSGSEQLVFVDRGNGFLEPRRVQAGERVGDRMAILSGVVEGERVVASGAFLVDSESRLKSAAAGMGRHD